MFAIAVLVVSYLLTRDAKTRGINPDLINDISFWLVISGIIGARIFYIILYLPYFLQSPSEIVMIHHGGLAWQGGLILGCLMGVWLIKKNKLSLRTMLDLFAPYIALGEAIGRIGCFLNGCCYGKEVSWGIYFPVHDARLHPTQLYTFAGLLLAFFLLKKFQKNNFGSGKVFVLYLILASSLRFVVEFFRADHDILLWGLSIYQLMSLAIIASAIYVQTRLKSHAGK